MVFFFLGSGSCQRRGRALGRGFRWFGFWERRFRRKIESRSGEDGDLGSGCDFVMRDLAIGVFGSGGIDGVAVL